MNIAARRHTKPLKLSVPQRAIRMAAIVWMLEGDQQLYQSLNSTALSLMRLEGLREAADAFEAGESMGDTCGTCGQFSGYGKFDETGRNLCASCDAKQAATVATTERG